MEFGFKIFFIIFHGMHLVASFSWSNCGTNTDPAKIISLDIKVNKTRILYVTGKGELEMNLTKPLKAQVKMQKKFFWGWTKVPCLDNVGSCTYADICSLSPFNGSCCPPEYTDNNLPCTCPILEGHYAAKNFPFDMRVFPQWLEKGKYRIKLKITQEDNLILCVFVDIQI